MGVGKTCVFQRRTVHISETVKDTAKVTINHYYCRKWHTSWQIRWKSLALDDLEGQ